MEGVAAGVPYVVLPPETDRPDAPTVVAWHLNDPPRTERAMAAALPLAGLDAWRVYLGLPLSGSRSPEGGLERLGYEDAVLKVYGPIVFGAAEEFPAALAALRAEHGLGTGRLGVLGGSVGALVAQQVAATRPAAKPAAGPAMEPVDAIALVSPVTRLRPLVVANGRRYGFDYPWRPASEEVAARLDFVARADEISAPTLLVVGEKDAPDGILEPAAALHAALPGSVLETVPGLEHALADEPGTDPSPQTAAAAAVDRIVARWFRRWLWL
jgi:pimeloyl-ACP methyl ester carboxylesterase